MIGIKGRYVPGGQMTNILPRLAQCLIAVARNTLPHDTVNNIQAIN